jgi:hypothetical protein
MSPTQRTLAECRRRGWEADIVERRVHRFVTKDFLGCIDIIAITPDGFLGIQACAGASHAARASKCRQQPRLATWFDRGAQVAVWSWSKRGGIGKRKLWQLREEYIVPVVAQ